MSAIPTDGPAEEPPAEAGEADRTARPAVVSPPMLAGFWRRVGADLVDGIILGAVGAVIGLALGSSFRAMGQSALLVGLSISLGYYTVFHSALYLGATPGKRLLAVEVVSLDGAFLSPARALLRALVPALLVYSSLYQGLLGWLAPRAAAALTPLWTAGGIFLLFTCYLIIPLHPWKRGLHDLVAGSIVVRRRGYDSQRLLALHDPARERALLMASGVLAVLLVLGTRSLLPGGSGVYSDLFDTAARVERIPGVRNAGAQLSDVTWTANGHTTHKRILVVSASLATADPRGPGADRLFALCFAEARQSAATLGSIDEIQVRLVSGWSIGIWSQTSFAGRAEPVARPTPTP